MRVDGNRFSGMRKGVLYSLCLHVAVLVLAVFGLPRLFAPEPATDVPIVVDLVTVAEKTNPPPPKRKPESAREAAARDREAEAKARVPQAIPAPPPLAQALPAPATARAEPPPPIPTRKPKAVTPVLKKRDRKPAEKPAETEFASVLRAIDAFRRKPPERAEPKREEAAAYAPPAPHNPDEPLTMSEVDALRRQIEACWNIPSGAREAEDLVVEVWTAINPDGTVSEARVVDARRMNADPFFRAAAESALRAIRHPRCTPLKLPSTKYPLWKNLVLKFDPKEMLRP